MEAPVSFYNDISRFGSAQALASEEGGALTYSETAAAADRFGSHVRDRQLVFILAANCVEAIVGYLGCLRANAPAALLASNISSDVLSSLLAIYQPRYLWLPLNRTSELSQLPQVFEQSSYVLLQRKAEPLRACPDLALMMTTSGSTGSPKFVRLSYGNLSANAASIAQYLAIESNARAITTLPMHYVYGLSVINSHLQAGAPIVLTETSIMEKRFWDLFRSTGATTISGVPYTYESLKRLGWDRMELPSLKVLTQAGGKLSAEIVREFATRCNEAGRLFYVMYGAAEATARMAYLIPNLAADKPASIGVPIPGGELWLEDENGEVITDSDVVGELTYRGANVFLGYAQNRQDLALGDVNHGVLKTGDLARRDNDGDYYITGRKNRFVKLFGNRVDLEHIEQMIRNAGIDCACTGDDKLLQVYVSGASKQDDVAAFVQQLTKLHKSAFRTILVESIPRNQAGKILYSELR